MTKLHQEFLLLLFLPPLIRRKKSGRMAFSLSPRRRRVSVGVPPGELHGGERGGERGGVSSSISFSSSPHLFSLLLLLRRNPQRSPFLLLLRLLSRDFGKYGRTERRRRWRVDFFAPSLFLRLVLAHWAEGGDEAKAEGGRAKEGRRLLFFAGLASSFLSSLLSCPDAVLLDPLPAR